VSAGGESPVAGQWDFQAGNLEATVGEDLEYFDGTTGQTASKTQFGTTTSFGIADINGRPATVMYVPGDANNQIGYIMRHGIALTAAAVASTSTRSSTMSTGPRPVRRRRL